MSWAYLPTELKSIAQWCVAGKDKAPHIEDGNSLRHVSVKERHSFYTFEEATQVAQRFNLGVGFVLCESDPFTCIDLDVKDIEPPCKQGKPVNKAQLTTEGDLSRFNQILSKFNSYTELSTSGKGAHIWVLGNIGSGCRRAGIEIYSRERFIICTGNAVEGLQYSFSSDGIVSAAFKKKSSLPIIECPNVLAELVRDVRRGNELVSEFELVEGEESESDKEIVERLMASKSAAKFNALCNGEWQDQGYPSQSEADLALLTYFAHLSESNEQCRRLFRMTKLGKREKATKNNKYLDRTLCVVRNRQAEEVRLELIKNSPLIQSSNSSMPKFSNGDKTDWMRPPGLAGDLCEYMEVTARRSRSELYPIAALHLMALVGRSRKTAFNTKLNLLSLSIAPTASGKEHPQEVLKRLAHKAGSSNLIHGNAGSFKDIIVNLLDGDGAALYVVDEVHSLFNSMNSRNAQTYESKIEAEILKLSTTALYNFRGLDKRDVLREYEGKVSSLRKQAGEGDEISEDSNKARELLSVYERRLENLKNGWPNPFFSLMGHSVPNRLDEFVSEENIDGGSIGRTLVVRCPDRRDKLRTESRPVEVIQKLETRIIRGLTKIGIGGAIVAPDDAGRVVLDETCEWFEEDEQRNHEILGGVYARATEHLYRV